MNVFRSVKDVDSVKDMVRQALAIKASPYDHQELGTNKTLGLIFLNPSLRTRMSTQIAGRNLGMNVMVMDMDKEGWALETREGVIMDGSTVEHIREAAGVLGEYCDIIGIRSFPALKDREDDYREDIFNNFIKYSGVPVVSLESATSHPLQSFADLITIEEHKKLAKPKVVLSWAPHVKALPQAVPNAFAEWMCRAQQEGMLDFVITHPEGFELSNEYTTGAHSTYNQDEALEGADFVYVKNWSSYHDYGKVLYNAQDWMLNMDRLKLTREARVMHCLPVRRDLELASDILDSNRSLVIAEAGNRVWAAQTVLKNILSA